MVIKYIKEAAKLSGITAVISNSTEKIETQLNRITGVEELPIMLIDWDLDTELTFNSNSFLNNPSIKVVALLMTKAESKKKEEFEMAAEEMGGLFQVFIQTLNGLLFKINTSGNQPISNAGYQMVPRYGLGVHSGVVGRFTTIGEIKNC